MDFNAVWMFLKVVETGSFTKAAKQIDVPKSTVSKKVADLEAELQVTLLRRTTRNIELTEVGKEFFARCNNAYAELRNAEMGTQTMITEPVGLLRVTAPPEFGQGQMSEILAQFLRANSKVTLEMLLTQDKLDFVRDKIDIAIRMGDLKDSSLLRRKVCVNRLHVVASPQYLQSHARIRQVEDLKQHNALIFSALDDPHLWKLRSANRRMRVRVHGSYVSNDVLSLKGMAMAGTGITLMPLLLCKAELMSGQLAIALPNWVAEEIPIHFLYRKEFFMPPKISAFMEFVAPALRAAAQTS